MYTQAATAMTTMLATTTTATNDQPHLLIPLPLMPLPLITLTVGVYLAFAGLWMWIDRVGDTGTSTPGDNSGRTQKAIGIAAMVIGLLIAMASFTALPPSTP